MAPRSGRGMKVKERQPRDVTINLRANERQRALLDRRFFLLDEKVYKRFTVALDKPPSDNPKLRRLLASKAPWER